MDSTLDPEAPEFSPNLASKTQDGYQIVQKTIRSCSYYPKGNAYELFKTLVDFNVISCQLSENILMMSNQIINTEQRISEFKGKDLEYIIDKVVETNDSLLDRVSFKMDTLKGVNKPSDTFLIGIKTNQNISAWNKPVLAQFQVGNVKLLGADNIPRPQLTFKDPVDNSDNLWVPKITNKPNNIKPLALTILYADDGDKLGFEHPYAPELEVYRPPLRFIEPDIEPIEYKTLEETKYSFIDNEKQLDELVDHLLKFDEIAIDLEYHNYRSYEGFTCLIQISTIEADYIVDPLVLREHIHKLNLVFTDPKIIKVFHGADNDIIWLQKDFGVYVVGLFDTHQAGKVLALPRISLKSLLIKYCDIDVDKKYQLADWRIRPLPNELITYARTDTHYLLYIWRKMKEELLALGGGDPLPLYSAFEQSRLVSMKTYTKPVIGETSHMSLYVNSRKNFNTQQMAALKMLYLWRDAQARQLDESTMYLMPNHMLLTLAENLPRDIQGINALCSPMPPFVKQNLVTIHRMMLSCREIPVIHQTYSAPMNVWNTVQPPINMIHDLEQFPRYGVLTQNSIEAINNAMSLTDYISSQNMQRPSRQGFMHNNNTMSLKSEPKLNENTKILVPFTRYQYYRPLAQLQELKELREKEAKILAISNDDTLIKKEILVKLQEAQSDIDKCVQNEQKPCSQIFEADDSQKVSPQRKRNLSLKRFPNAKQPKKEEVDLNDKESEEMYSRNIEPKTEPSDNNMMCSRSVEEMNELEDEEPWSETFEQKVVTQPKIKGSLKKFPKALAKKLRKEKKDFKSKESIKMDSRNVEPKTGPSVYKNVDYKKFYSDTNKGIVKQFNKKGKKHT